MKWFALGFIILVIFTVATTVLITSERAPVKSTGKLYFIRYYDNNNETSVLADTIYSRSERCIEFRNVVGYFRQSVCAENITITSPLN